MGLLAGPRDYTYENDADPTDGHTREILPLRIDYTRQGTAPASRAVVFSYSDVSVRTLYSGGLTLQQSKQLQQVLLELTPGDAVVRSYSFEYGTGPGTARTVLTSVAECVGATGPCKPATVLSWSGQAGGFTKQVTPPYAADWSWDGAHRHGSWVLADVNGDGLDDLVMVNLDEKNTAMDDWRVALNTGGAFGPATSWAVLPHPHTDSTIFEALTLTPIDVDQDGNADIFLDTPNPDASSWPHYRWLQSVPGAPAGQRFVLRDTEVTQPQGVYYDPPASNAALEYEGSSDAFLRQHHRFARLGDVNGDGVADLIQCLNETWDDQGYTPSPGNAVWTVNLWSPSLPDGTGPGFDPTPIVIPGLDLVDCATGLNHVNVVDIDGDGASELLVAKVDGTFAALRFQGTAAGWQSLSTNLPVQDNAFRRLHFLDVNGDGLTDAVYTGYGYDCPYSSPQGCPEPPLSVDGLPMDVPFQALNDGKSFSLPSWMLSQSLFPPGSLPTGGGATDWWGDQALALDYDGDGRMDLLMPIDGHCGPGAPDPLLPCWVVLRSDPQVKGYFSVVKSPPATGFAKPFDTRIPAVVDFDYSPTGEMLSWFLPQVTDVDGDGRHDLVVPDPSGNGAFDVYRNTAPQDLLIGITDGLNPLDPSDPGFVPTVSVSYGSLVDQARTQALPAGSSAAEPALYLSHADPANGCTYPRACVVGSSRVVSAFRFNDGQNGERSFSMRYRDARYHHLGRGLLGFGEVIALDDDAGSGRADFYDDVTWDAARNTFPFAGQVVRSEAWSPASATQTTPTQMELSFSKTTLKEVGDATGASYFTLPVEIETQRAEGNFQAGPGLTLQQFVEGNYSTVLEDTTTTVTKLDAYGNVLAQNRSTKGVDLGDTTVRTVTNDTAHWLLGEVTDETRCSQADQTKRCVETHRIFDVYGELTTTVTGDPTDKPGTQLSVSYQRDGWGNVRGTTADDGYQHHRSACISYDPEGIYPYAIRNGVGHTALFAFDTGLGVKTGAVDPNGLVTSWQYDGFGRLIQELRPDGTWTKHSLTRTKDGGPFGAFWTVRATTQEDAGPSTTTALDGLGRPVQTVTATAAVSSCGASLCANQLTVEQDTQYDTFGRVVRVTLPWMQGDSLQGKYADVYAYDAAGRTTSHTEPWGRVTKLAYANDVTTATDWLGTTSTAVDALGRTVLVTDKKGGTTQTTYGPFSASAAVTRFGTETTTTVRDAYGRTIVEEDPDRGATYTWFDGFGDTYQVFDALGRTYRFTYDGIGRLVQRDDQAVDGTVATTTWAYDPLPFGVGRLGTVTSPAKHVDAYTYDPLSRPATHTLTLGDTGDAFSSTTDYDTLGRPWHLTYPAAPGVAPLTVRREYDAFGNLIALHDDATTTTFWQLQQLDGAGRAAREGLANGVRVTRDYAPATGLVEHIGAERAVFGQALVPLQELSYGHDLGLRMITRSDGLQGGSAGAMTEYFSHDVLDRFECSRFGAGPPSTSGKFVRCQEPIGYDPNGNILNKDGRAYGYDPQHPHAVATAGGDAFAYDAVGNQISRPGVDTITYTPFDLPAQYTLANDKGVVALDYDGGQHRIRKQTAQSETVYFDDLYERVSPLVSNGSADLHRYYVAAGSATVVLTRAAGATDQVAYLLGEALGSVDVVTDGAGALVQQRSYDAFGARRNQVWGQPPPPTGFTSAASPLGFTGQEEDDELGLVNMRGRIYDPKVARFLTTDPLVSQPGFTQSWNPYSYVWNSPLSFTDPSGFEPTITVPRITILGQAPTMEERLGAAVDLASSGAMAKVAPPSGAPTSDWRSPGTKDTGRDDSVQGGPAGVPQAVREGSPFAPGSGGLLPEPPPERERGGGDQPAARMVRELERGVLGGLVPGGVSFDGAGAGSRGTAQDRFARAFGHFIGGFLATLGGSALSGEGALFTGGTGGGGGAAGVPAMVAGGALIAGGLANQAGALAELTNIFSKGSGAPSTAERPKNMSPDGAKRQGAFNEAKRASGIPKSQQPERVQPNLDRRGNPQPGKQYVFKDAAGREVIIRDDAGGHDFGPGDPQNRGPHFNDAAGNHYDY